MLRLIVVGTLAALTWAAPALAHRDDWGVCTSDAVMRPEKRIAACNAALESVYEK